MIFQWWQVLQQNTQNNIKNTTFLLTNTDKLMLEAVDPTQNRSAPAL